MLGNGGQNFRYEAKMKRRVEDEGKDLPKDFGRKASDGGEDGFVGFYGLYEIWAPNPKGRRGFVKQCHL
jgi:hypothetical protein